MTLHGEHPEDIERARELFHMTNRFGQPTDAALRPLLQRIRQEREDAARVAVRPPTLPESWPSLPATPEPDLGEPLDEAERDRLAAVASARETERDELSAHFLSLDLETVAVSDYAEASALLSAAQSLSSALRSRADEYAARLEAQRRAVAAKFEAECVRLESLEQSVKTAQNSLEHDRRVASDMNVLDYTAMHSAEARLPESGRHLEDAKAAVEDFRREHPEVAAHVDASKAERQRQEQDARALRRVEAGGA